MNILESIMGAIKKYRKFIIIIVIVIIAIIVAVVFVSSLRNVDPGESKIESIYAVNEKEYDTISDIDIKDFTVYAVYENGAEVKIENYDTLTLDSSSCVPIGDMSTVTIYYTEETEEVEEEEEESGGLFSSDDTDSEENTIVLEDEAFSCEAEVIIKREAVAGIKCGYPNTDDVTAVLYSNGELCFEGEGDVMVFQEGSAPWFDLETNIDIVAVSFEDTVSPTNMNYWFENLETLIYCGEIPPSVMTMVKTFSSCTEMTSTAVWQDSEELLNISECYSGCTSITTADAIPSSARVAQSTFSGCTALLQTPDMENAVTLTDAAAMFQDCEGLVQASVAPNVEDMSNMFYGCINLKDMPEIPASVSNMEAAFQGDISLKELTTIPASVTNLADTFNGCEIISGEVTINANAENFTGMFSDAALATLLNLTGDSKLLDGYANTCESGNVFVNGEYPDSSITTYSDVFNQNNNEQEESSQTGQEEIIVQEETTEVDM